MPIYEYNCPGCGRFEQIQKFSDEPLAHCPHCHGRVEKLMSAPAIQFKGSGWYITDYARKNSPAASPAPPAETSAPAPAKENSITPPNNTSTPNSTTA